MITLSLYLATALLIATKIMDGWTTHARLRDVQQELNGPFRWLMKQIGVQAAIGVNVLLGSAFGLIVLWGALRASRLEQIATLAGLLLISGMQAQVAYHNWTGYSNGLLRRLAVSYVWISAQSRRIRFK